MRTDIDHNISDKTFKKCVAETAERIRYSGQEYIDKLNQLNSQYHYEKVRIIEERQYSAAQV